MWALCALLQTTLPSLLSWLRLRGVSPAPAISFPISPSPAPCPGDPKSQRLSRWTQQTIPHWLLNTRFPIETSLKSDTSCSDKKALCHHLVIFSFLVIRAASQGGWELSSGEIGVGVGERGVCQGQAEVYFTLRAAAQGSFDSTLRFGWYSRVTPWIIMWRQYPDSPRYMHTEWRPPLSPARSISLFRERGHGGAESWSRWAAALVVGLPFS